MEFMIIMYSDVSWWSECQRAWHSLAMLMSGCGQYLECRTSWQNMATQPKNTHTHTSHIHAFIESHIVDGYSTQYKYSIHVIHDLSLYTWSPAQFRNVPSLTVCNLDFLGHRARSKNSGTLKPTRQESTWAQSDFSQKTLKSVPKSPTGYEFSLNVPFSSIIWSWVLCSPGVSKCASHIPLAQMAQLRCRSRHDCWTPGASLQLWLLKMARFHSIQRNLPVFIGIIRGSACCFMHWQKLNLKSLTSLCKLNLCRTISTAVGNHTRKLWDPSVPFRASLATPATLCSQVWLFGW